MRGAAGPTTIGASVRDTADAVAGQWDRLLLLAEQIEPGDWSRATAVDSLDVRGLVTHIVGVDRALDGDAADPLAGLRAARTRSAREHRTGTPQVERVLAAGCLDLWVHAYDLGSALGTTMDLDEDSTAVRAASAYVLRFLPQLLAARPGTGDDRSVRVVLRGAAAHDGVAAVRGGRWLWLPPDHAADDSVTATPAALVLLLSGRATAEDLRAADALAWSGTAAQDLVRHTRLPG